MTSPLINPRANYSAKLFHVPLDRAAQHETEI